MLFCLSSEVLIYSSNLQGHVRYPKQSSSEEIITVLVVTNITHNWLLFSRDTGGSGGILDFNTCFLLISGTQLTVLSSYSDATRMPTGGQLLLIVVALAASADMMTIMCMKSDVGRSQLAGNNEYGSCRHSHDYDATTTSSSSGTCSSLKLLPWSIWNIITVANFEPGPCHWTLEVGTGLNH